MKSYVRDAHDPGVTVPEQTIVFAYDRLRTVCRVVWEDSVGNCHGEDALEFYRTSPDGTVGRETYNYHQVDRQIEETQFVRPDLTKADEDDGNVLKGHKTVDDLFKTIVECHERLVGRLTE